jgi:hypothetical protein
MNILLYFLPEGIVVKKLDTCAKHTHIINEKINMNNFKSSWK